jgi:SagB-type dehydrogenase family enzyme
MVKEGRRFLMSPINSPADLIESDEDKGIEAPPIQKPHPSDAELVDLIAPEEFSLGDASLITVLKNRKSRRKYVEDALTLEEISFSLWAVQGVRHVGARTPVTFRTVPASGGIHPFETYLVVNKVENLQPGLYRYLPIEHKLLLVSQVDPEWLERLVHACRGQEFVGKGAVVFIWTTIPYRTEWRYANEAHKVIAQASGHVCQNLYLASEAIGAGTCAVAAYAQSEIDSLVGVDGQDEFVVYVAPVGKARN